MFLAVKEKVTITNERFNVHISTTAAAAEARPKGLCQTHRYVYVSAVLVIQEFLQSYFATNFNKIILEVNKIFLTNEWELHVRVFAVKTEEDEGFGDYFFGEEFHLPANIGYNDEGVLLFYNVYEIASYAVGITEFTIPFEEVEDYLSIF